MLLNDVPRPAFHAPLHSPSCPFMAWVPVPVIQADSIARWTPLGPRSPVLDAPLGTGNGAHRNKLLCLTRHQHCGRDETLSRCGFNASKTLERSWGPGCRSSSGRC